MKFEIINEEIQEPETIKARLSIARSGDLDIYINDMLIAYIEAETGRLMRIKTVHEAYLHALRAIGIKLDGENKIETN